MTRPKRPVDKHYESAKEHLAGVHAAARWYQDLVAQHLLDSQQPIKDEPVPPAGGKGA